MSMSTQEQSSVTIRNVDADTLRMFGIRVPSREWADAERGALDRAAMKDQAIAAGIVHDDAALWAELQQQFKPLFAELGHMQVTLDEALLAEAEAAEAVQVHLERRPSKPGDVQRWALRRSELVEVHSAHAALVEEHQRAFNGVAARLSGEIWKALTQHLDLAEYHIAQAEQQAQALRKEADELVLQAKRKRTAMQRLHARVVADGVHVFEEGEQ